MARRASFVLEQLETRTLLSGLSYSLTTDQTVYSVGEPIQMTFTETNTGDQPVTVNAPPGDFIVNSPGGFYPTWESNPGDAGQPVTLTLQPGQSDSQTATWDGTTTSVTGQTLAPWGTFTLSDPDAAQGLTATFQVTDPFSFSLTTDQSVYQVGEPIQITLAETNTSDEPVLDNVAGYFSLSVSQDGGGVWRQSDEPSFSFPIVIGEPIMPGTVSPSYAVSLDELEGVVVQPGGSLSWTSTWDGIPNAVPLSILSGSFTVAAQVAGQSPSATFQITPPPAAQLTTSVTTDQSVYQLGEPIEITYTETNTGDQPATVIVGGSFDVTQDGNDVWNSGTPSQSVGINSESPDNDPELHWETLQTGQSYSETVGWTNSLQENPVPETGTFVVSVEGDPNQSSATFQVEGLAYSLTTDQSVYQVGEPVQMTFTETNTSDQPITIVPALVAFNIAFEGTLIWGNSPLYTGQPTVTLQPGQSDSQTVTWDGIDDDGGALNPWGTFVASVSGDPQQVTFQVADPQILYSLTTDQSVYQVGEPVQMTFTETNTGDQPVTIDPNFVGFTITQDGSLVWEPDSASSSQATVTLQPGQSYAQTVTWDGIPTDVPYNGVLNSWGTFVVSVAAFSQQTTFEVADPHLVYSLTTDQSVYYYGEPVQMTLTETNTGDQPVTIDPGLVAFAITQDGDLVGWNDPTSCRPSPVTLEPGQSYSLTEPWSGYPRDPLSDLPLNLSGTFVVSVAGISQRTTFQVTDPQVVYSLTTDQLVYQVGEPIQITLTATNPGDQPTTVPVSPAGFSVVSEGDFQTVWQSNTRDPSQPTSVTLQPGQSFTQTATWSGIVYGSGGPVDATGVLEAAWDGVAAYATFQIVAPPAQPSSPPVPTSDPTSTPAPSSATTAQSGSPASQGITAMASPSGAHHSTRHIRAGMLRRLEHDRNCPIAGLSKGRAHHAHVPKPGMRTLENRRDDIRESAHADLTDKSPPGVPAGLRPAGKAG